MSYAHETWKLTLPKGWKAEETDHCVLFYHPKSEGALQISSFYKEDGLVEQSDLYSFSEETDATPVEFNYLSGLYLEGEEDDGFIDRQWWLASDSEILFITYSNEADLINSEVEQVEAILNSLHTISPS